MRSQRYDIRYIELKTGYHDDGPAWIGRVLISRSGRSVYFNDHGFQRCNAGSGNYTDIETGVTYWISGVKKDGSDRHWAGHGKIVIDRKIVKEYLALVECDALDPARFEVADIEEAYPVERIRNLLNESSRDA